MEWMRTTEAFIGFLVTLSGLFVWIIKTAIKLNKLKEQVDTVPTQQNKIAEIDEKMGTIETDLGEIKGGMKDLKESLKDHTVEQKEDIKTINAGLLTLMEMLTDPTSPNAKLEAAKERLQNRLLDK
ncbi:MAG: hypothetical protein ACOYI6_04085 [Christensenellales bacterium]|jgi:seryl-tRNA synthetase